MHSASAAYPHLVCSPRKGNPPAPERVTGKGCVSRLIYGPYLRAHLHYHPNLYGSLAIQSISSSRNLKSVANTSSDLDRTAS